MLDFYKTQAGRMFFDGTLPRIADALEKIAKNIDTQKQPETVEVNTVNVIEFGDTVNRVSAFYDNPEGNKKAEELFVACIKENSDYNDEQIQNCLDDGYFDIGTYSINLVHSS